VNLPRLSAISVELELGPAGTPGAPYVHVLCLPLEPNTKSEKKQFARRCCSAHLAGLRSARLRLNFDYKFADAFRVGGPALWAR
jgi:hypothetical protein